MAMPKPDRPMHRLDRGMTLIEILIVIAITALMMGMLVFGFGAGRQAEVGRAINQVGNTIRYGYDKARVNGGYYRILIDLEKGTFSLQEGDGRMYLPATDRDGKLLEIDESKAEAQEARDRRAEESFNRSVASKIIDRAPPGAAPEAGEAPEGAEAGEAKAREAKAGETEGAADGGAAPGDANYDPYAAGPRKVPRRKPPLFNSFEEESQLTGFNKPIELPEGVKVTYVRTADDLEPITEGQASIFFFPRGRTQKAHIVVEDPESESKWTIKVEPLTGRVTIVDGKEELELPEDPDEEEDDLGRERERRTF